MKLLRLLTLPYVLKHKLRSALTVAGIAIGVAVFAGMHTANRTVEAAFQQTVDRIAGKTQLQVTAGEAGVPEAVLERVQSVREAGAVAPVIEAVARTNLEGVGNLLVLGVDMTGDRSLRDYDLEEDDVIDDPLVFLAQPDSIIVSREFSAKSGIGRDGKLTLETMNGPRQFTVRGIMKTGGLTQAFGGNLAVMDIYAAQLMFGRGRQFDRIDIGLAEGATLDACQRNVSAAAGSGFEVNPPSSRGRQFEAISRSLSFSINMTSLFALLTGTFIIYNSFSIAVTQRRPEIGVLRVLGASRRRILLMFLLEAAVAGVVGSAVGIWAGLAMARGLAPLMSMLVRNVYGTPQVADDIAVSSSLIALAMAIGVAVSLLGAWLPARNAARVDPVKALRKGSYQMLSAGENRWRLGIAVALAMAAAAGLMLANTSIVVWVGYLPAILAAVFLAPSLSLWLAKLLRPLLARIRRIEGGLAADSLIQAPRRTSATVSALMLSLAMAIGFAGVSVSIYRQLLDWMDDALNPDLFVAPTEHLTHRDYRFPPEITRELEAIPGIEEVQPVRNLRVPVGGTPAMLVATDVRQVTRRIRMKPVEGEREEMKRLTEEGKATIISDSLSRIRGLHKGDVLEIGTPSGLVRLPIAGTTVDFSDQQGSFIVDRTFYRKHWQDESSNLFRIYLRKGEPPDRVREEILRRLGHQRQLFVYTNAGLRKLVIDTTGQWFGMTYLQLAIAVLVAILGIVNSLTVSITDRRRELGVLQAVGGLRNQIRATIWLEALAIGAVGMLLGCALGAVTLYCNIALLRGEVGGLRIDFTYPFAFVLGLVPAILGSALVASIWPAEAAVRASLVESLEYE